MKTTVWVPKEIAGRPLAPAPRRSSTAGALRRRSLTLGCLLAGILLGALPAVASAAAEMPGEWQLVLTSGGRTLRGTAIISQEANASGEFAASSMFVEGVDPGTFTGTLHGTEASVRLTAQAYGQLPQSEFTSTTMAIQSSGSSLSMSGSGTASSAGTSASATLTATRVRTYKEIEEQRERELKEQEEREARENVRGEWTLVLKSGSQTVHGVARIIEAANERNEFVSKAALFESAVPGSFSGTLEGAKATVKVTSEAAGPLPASTFTSSAMSLTTVAGGMSMSGSGTLTIGTSSMPATLEATRVKTYVQLQELEAKEKLERETREREAREAKEREAREAQERLEREARERLEKEQTAKVLTQTTTTQSGQAGTSATLVSVGLAGNSASVGSSSSLALKLSNPNGFAIAGRVTLLAATHAHKALAHRPGKRSSGSLGTASFGISAKGTATVHVRLSQLGRAELARHKALHVVAIVTTEANGHPSTTKRYSLTLRASAHRRR